MTIAYRPPRNPVEKRFYFEALSKGWKASKRGWPDYFCQHSETLQVIAVEVKRNARHSLNRNQHHVMLELAKLGMPCFVLLPEDLWFQMQLDGSLKPCQNPLT